MDRARSEFGLGPPRSRRPPRAGVGNKMATNDKTPFAKYQSRREGARRRGASVARCCFPWRPCGWFGGPSNRNLTCGNMRNLLLRELPSPVLAPASGSIRYRAPRSSNRRDCVLVCPVRAPWRGTRAATPHRFDGPRPHFGSCSWRCWWHRVRQLRGIQASVRYSICIDVTLCVSAVIIAAAPQGRLVAGSSCSVRRGIVVR